RRLRRQEERGRSGRDHRRLRLPRDRAPVAPPGTSPAREGDRGREGHGQLARLADRHDARRVRGLRPRDEDLERPAQAQGRAAAQVDGWDLRDAMTNAGLPREKAAALFPEAKAYWRERFFTSAWCTLDVAIPGAASFLHAIHETGAVVAYVTGRDENMREGSV